MEDRHYNDVKVGDIVHYVLPEKHPGTRLDLPSRGECRPAIVTQTWTEGVVNLHIIPDYENDGFSGPFWATSIPSSQQMEANRNTPDTWHWIHGGLDEK